MIDEIEQYNQLQLLGTSKIGNASFTQVPAEVVEVVIRCTQSIVHVPIFRFIIEIIFELAFKLIAYGSSDDSHSS